MTIAIKDLKKARRQTEEWLKTASPEELRKFDERLDRFSLGTEEAKSETDTRKKKLKRASG